VAEKKENRVTIKEQLSQAETDQAFASLNFMTRDLRTIMESHATRDTAEEEKLLRITGQCYSMYKKLEDIQLGDKPISTISRVTQALYGVTDELENWLDEIKSRKNELYRFNAIPAEGIPKKQEMREEILDCAVHEFMEDDAVVIVMVNGKAEKRVMSKEQLSKAHVVREGQPFIIEVMEKITADGLETSRYIKPMGDHSKWTSKPVRPELDVEKFKRKPEEV